MLHTMPKVSGNRKIQAEYEEMRMNGQSHNCAMMFVAQSAPGVQSDTTFMAGRKLGGGQFEDNEMDQHYATQAAAAAKKAGVSITGKYYSHALATKKFDPKAWINDRSDVRRVCQENGMHCEGAVNVKGKRPDKMID